jgi:hypothetical protein
MSHLNSLRPRTLLSSLAIAALLVFGSTAGASATSAPKLSANEAAMSVNTIDFATVPEAAVLGGAGVLGAAAGAVASAALAPLSDVGLAAYKPIAAISAAALAPIALVAIAVEQFADYVLAGTISSEDFSRLFSELTLPHGVDIDDMSAAPAQPDSAGKVLKSLLVRGGGLLSPRITDARLLTAVQ